MKDGSLAKQSIDDGFNGAARNLMNIFYDAALVAKDGAEIQQAAQRLDAGLSRLEIGRNYLYDLYKLNT